MAKAYPKDHPRSRIRGIKEQLIHQAEELMSLADHLGSVDGRPLNDHEKTLIRTSYLSQLQEMNSELERAYLMGNRDHETNVLDEIRIILDTVAVMNK